MLVAAGLSLAVTAGCGEDPVVVCPAMFPLKITLTPAGDTVGVGETASYRAAVTGNGGSTGPCARPPVPGGVSWSVSNGTLATITASTDSTAVVRATAVGTTMVIATALGDPTLKTAGLLVVRQ